MFGTIFGWTTEGQPYKCKSLSLSDWLTEWWSYTIGWLMVGVSWLAVALSKWVCRNVSYVPQHYEYRRSPLKLPLVALSLAHAALLVYTHLLRGSHLSLTLLCITWTETGQSAPNQLFLRLVKGTGAMVHNWRSIPYRLCRLRLLLVG